MTKTLLLACVLLTSATSAFAADESTAVPEGTLYENVYSSSDRTFMVSQGGLGSFTDNAGYNTRIVINGNKIYIHNIITEYNGLDAWIEGEITGGIAQFAMPQKIGTDKNNNAPLYIDVLKPVESLSSVTLSHDTENPMLKMSWDGKKLTQIRPGTSTGDLARYDGMVGLVNEEGHFLSYGEAGLSYTIWDKTPAVPSSELTTASYTAFYKDQWNDNAQTYTSIAIDGNTAWIQGLCYYLPNSWVKGTLSDDGNAITIDSDQYLGLYNNYFIFLYAADATGKTAGQEFAWKDNATLTKSGDDWEANGELMVNLGETRPWFGYGIKGLVLTKDLETDPVPANPQWGAPEWSDTDGMGAADFEIPATDINGQALDTEKLYYRLYFDGELQNPSAPDFKYGEYVEYDHGIVFFDYGWHCVAFFAPLKTLGVQSVYKPGDKEFTSDIVTYKFNDSSVNGITGDSKTILSVEYYNISGQRLTYPEGFCIRQIRYTDGSTGCDKVIIRK